jgi:hypothetical protein
MELILKRTVKKETFTLGVLSLNDVFQCYVLEDTDRDLTNSMALSDIVSVKIPGRTAIPAGRYEIVMSFSNRFQKYLPLMLDVPGFAGVRIHAGNTTAHTEGCLLPGNKKDEVNGRVFESRVATQHLIRLISSAVKKEKVFINISK